VGKKSWLTVVVLVLNSLPSCIHIMFRFVKEEEIIPAVVVISPDIQLCSAMFHTHLLCYIGTPVEILKMMTWRDVSIERYLALF